MGPYDAKIVVLQVSTVVRIREGLKLMFLEWLINVTVLACFALSDITAVATVC